jgi:hypothetical protein
MCDNSHPKIRLLTEGDPILACLTIFKYNPPGGARQMLEKVRSMQKIEISSR